MFTTTAAGMSLTVNGGSAEENSQMCAVVAAALRTHGFRNVQVEVQNEIPLHTTHDADTISAMRRINPDLFDTPVVVGGESEDDMRATMASLGFEDKPFAFRLPDIIRF